LTILTFRVRPACQSLVRRAGKSNPDAMVFNNKNEESLNLAKINLLKVSHQFGGNDED
jgi:hypothetical protein